MAEDLDKAVFTCIDNLYNEFSNEKRDPELLKLLLTAGKAINKKTPAQIVATKTVNGISLYALSNKQTFSREANEEINQLRTISRKGGYKWSAAGLGDFRTQF